ncbi:HNH endonuclease [Oceanobacillus profundus]|uniref:HNH endonuclease n=1 Tax=Oceanobacillus TaxID=182709 RepID=UPI0026E2DEFC|nr:HNH endonuclease [Oceanobacillus profundus]MDO6448998.1 HNH endonuclease [Oceanobacillus profundus]
MKLKTQYYYRETTNGPVIPLEKPGLDMVKEGFFTKYFNEQILIDGLEGMDDFLLSGLPGGPPRSPKEIWILEPSKEEIFLLELDFYKSDSSKSYEDYKEFFREYTYTPKYGKGKKHKRITLDLNKVREKNFDAVKVDWYALDYYFIRKYNLSFDYGGYYNRNDILWVNWVFNEPINKFIDLPVKEKTENNKSWESKYRDESLDISIETAYEADDVGFTEDDEGFPEGKLILKQHLVRERNSKIIKLAKERFIQQHGKLFCEVCEFDFKARYGNIGEGYIEGHHTRPISEMTENEETKVDDIALVCANCHRMLHRKRPWLTINKLKELLK